MKVGEGAKEAVAHREELRAAAGEASKVVAMGAVGAHDLVAMAEAEEAMAVASAEATQATKKQTPRSS